MALPEGWLADTSGRDLDLAAPSWASPVADEVTPRAKAWADTMAGHLGGDLVRAHAGSASPRRARTDRAIASCGSSANGTTLRPGAAFAEGAGNRAIVEEPDDERTCFERDRDRIVHSTAFRRLAGKTQVVVYPTDHQRTRLTHALEVAQVATSIARGVGVNVTLADAIALGHDCGHGPGGHASEDAFDAFIPEGYDHGPWGADVVLQGLNLCAETLDGIRNHSWSRPAPLTVEGEIVSWADRIAYCAHDLEDAIHAGIVAPDDLPDEIVEVCGRTRREQLNTFVRAVVRAVDEHGEVGMPPEEARCTGGAAGVQLRTDLRAAGLAGAVPRSDRRATCAGRVLQRSARPDARRPRDPGSVRTPRYERP